MNLKVSVLPIIGMTVCFLFFSCSNQEEKQQQAIQQSSPLEPTEQANTQQSPTFSSENIEAKTFEVKDTLSGKSLGWGYDLYVDGHLTIHQPIIPGVSGNHSFSTEEKAKKTGTFAIKKMKLTGGLPTITIKELDSLDVTK
ncbi:hypothetical protein BH10BAC1_BH10BAC1_07330 [soil metagenome]